MNEVFEISGGLVEPKVAHNLMRIIGEGEKSFNFIQNRVFENQHHQS